MMNMKRMLSLILAFVMVLGMIPVPAFANEGEEETSVDVVLSLSTDDCFMVGPGTGEVMAMKEISVPYFDLALYGLEEYYFVSEEYGDDGDGLPGSDLEPGTPEYAYGKVTLLHLYLYALEVYYCGIEPEEAGKGYLYDEGLIGTEVFSISGGVGSSFLNQFWGGDCNLNYYVNYEYPLASTGWGATADQILLREGDIITLGHFSGWSFYGDPYSIFNYITADNANPTKGEEITLTLYYAGADMGMTGGTAQNLNTYCLDVYYAPADDIPSEYVTDWEFIGTADENGQLVVDTAMLDAGEYIFAVAGQYGESYTDEICSTPGGVRVSVEEAEAPEEKDYPFTVTVGGEAMTEFVLSEVNDPYSGTVPLYTVTIPEGTTEVTITWNDGNHYTLSYYDTNCNYFGFESGMQNSWNVAMDKNGDGAYDMLQVYDSGWAVPYWITFANPAAEEPEEPADPVTATVYFSVTEHSNIVEANGVPMALVEMTVPYFDIGLYGLEDVYYNPDCYGAQAGATSQVGGTAETADGVVTILHVLIWATEVYWCGLDEADAGKGWLANEGDWNGFSVQQPVPGSAFCTFWNFGSNLNYYLNYEYPLAYPGWGATCDQIPVSDGDVISMRYNAYTGNDGVYHHFGKPYIVSKDVLQGNQVSLTLFACTEDYTGYTTGHEPVGEGEYVYVVSEIGGDVLAEGTTNAYGDVRLDTSKLAVGSYYVLSDTFDPAMAILNIVSNVHTHSYEEVVTEPTCTEGGYTTYTCSCGDSYVGAYTSALGHDVVDGTCTRCGMSQTVIPEGAPFLSMVTDKGETVTITDMGMDPMYYMGTMYKVEVPLGTERVDVTYNEADVLVDQFGYAVAMMLGFSHVSQEGYPQSTSDGKTTVGLSMVKAASNGAPMPVELLNVPYPEDPYELRYMGLMNDDQSQFHFFVFTYKLEEGQYFVDLPAGVGYTVTGEPIASDGYTFNISIAEGYEASEDFAVLVNGEVVATEPGDITIESVTADLHIEIDGVVKIVNPETDISVTIDLSGYDGIIEGNISYMNMSYESVDVELKAGKKNSLAMTAADNGGFFAQIYTISPLVLGYDVNGTVYPLPSDYTGYDLGNGFHLNLNYDGYMNLQTQSSNPGVFVVKPIVATPNSVGAAPAFNEDHIRVNDISIIGADVDSYAWDGDTLNVVLAEGTALDAPLKTMWNIYANNTKEGAGQALFNINGRLQTPQREATCDWTNGIVLADGTATMTVAFEVANVYWDPASQLEFTNKTFTINFTIAEPEPAPALNNITIVVPDSLTPNETEDGIIYTGLKLFKQYNFSYVTDPEGLDVDVTWRFVDAGGNSTIDDADTFSASAYMNGMATLTLTAICGDVTIEKTIYITDKLPHEHSYEAVVTAPTCTEAGFTTYTCACGDSYTADETAALGHDWKGTSCGRCGETRENPFTDVPEDSFYIDPVLWAVETGITTGATDTTFDPTGDLLRAQVVTMLWRAAGKPAPATDVNPFTDVTEEDWYYEAVLWAVSEGITNGTSATTFDPYGKTNRAQAITFLWRYLDKPEAGAENPFADVDTNEWYADAVLWAVANSVTEGMSATEFGIGFNCNRAHMVTFMFRALA